MNIAEWIDREGVFKDNVIKIECIECSRCGKTQRTFRRSPYCPNCGARMKGVDETWKKEK